MRSRSGFSVGFSRQSSREKRDFLDVCFQGEVPGIPGRTRGESERRSRHGCGISARDAFQAGGRTDLGLESQIQSTEIRSSGIARPCTGN